VFTYTLTLFAAPGTDAPAFNVLVEDALSPCSSLCIRGSLDTTAGTATILGNTIRVEIPVLLPDAPPVVITYRAAFTDAIEPGQVVPNRATLDYASAPGISAATSATTPRPRCAASSTSRWPRRSSRPLCPRQEASISTPSLPDLAAGETVTYRLTASLSEGTQRFVIEDTLPPGLVPEKARLVSVGAGILAAAPVITIAGAVSPSTSARWSTPATTLPATPSSWRSSRA
jgi:large repetitive protein